MIGGWVGRQAEGASDLDSGDGCGRGRQLRRGANNRGGWGEWGRVRCGGIGGGGGDR